MWAIIRINKTDGDRFTVTADPDQRRMLDLCSELNLCAFTRTSEHEYHVEEGDFLQAERAPAKVAVASIKLERAEGPSDQCGVPVTVATFAEANAVLRQWAQTIPADMLGYDKTDFWVTFADGEVYAGRYDLTHKDQTSADLGEHMRSFLRFEAGDSKPAHLTEKQYADYLKQSESYTPGVANDCRDFLTKYQID